MTLFPNHALRSLRSILEWAVRNDCGINEDTCRAAAEGGHLRVLQWLHAEGCPWNWTACRGAQGGYDELLRWAAEEGCPWRASYMFAAAAGQLEVLKWAKARGCEWRFGTCSKAAGGGHLPVLQCAVQNECP